jgi:hypothetical protein
MNRERQPSSTVTLMSDVRGNMRVERKFKVVRSVVVRSVLCVCCDVVVLWHE